MQTGVEEEESRGWKDTGRIRNSEEKCKGLLRKSGIAMGVEEEEITGWEETDRLKEVRNGMQRTRGSRRELNMDG